MRLDLPKDKDLAHKVIEARHAQQLQRIEVGMVGRIFGNAAEKPGNIAGFIVFVFSAMFCGVLIWGGSLNAQKDILAILSSFITLALGYLFGRSST